MESKVTLFARLGAREREALEAWVGEHGEEFDSVAVYDKAITLRCAGVPPHAVVRRGRIVADLDEALAYAKNMYS